MFPYLASTRVNLQLYQETVCRELLEILEKCDGSKTIVLDDNLFGPILLIASPSLFSDRNIKIQRLRVDTRFPKDAKNIIYITRPELKHMDIIASHIHGTNSSDNRTFHLYFVPRKSCLCTKQLEIKGVYGNFTNIDNLPWIFFPVDKDILSMELPNSFRDLSLDDDLTCLYQAAIGLVQIQKIYGRIPKIYGKGKFAHKVWEYAKLMGTEDKTMFNSDKGTVDQMIILDRGIDLMSVLVTQLTYEGLIDEIYSIHQNKVSLPGKNFAKSNDDASHANLVPEQKVLYLNSDEKLYGELRDKNFNEVGKILSKSAKSISSQMEASYQDKSVQDMKIFVDRLPELLKQKQSVATHTTVAELIREYLDTYEFTDDLAAEQEFMVCEDIDKQSAYIEDLIAKKSDIRNVLRLMCIQCVAASGFKQKTLNLTVDDVVEVAPKDISYVHSFYAPLTVRIVEQSLKPLGWQSLKSSINVLPGKTFEDFQAQLIGINGRQSSTPSEGSSLNVPRVVLVFFVGGCTFAEISALRFLSQQEDNNVEFVIATTKLLNKNSFLDTLIEFA
ncbi:vacuolar protein sorting-associated protein 33A isoform X2 [Episyrphus balteatus]|uniref:vacuolar protein sorting-associated protein 33A isoform X2 n=1 Tax=Episyrphus balteatus TaxID=286459 RepID=UPI00248503D0|nr:vacuolar protein sorting-associated protein 33A isoform X2 [Episyrphus balteatus]